MVEAFLKCTVEVDGAVVSDGETVLVATILAHVESKVCHSEDTAGMNPLRSLVRGVTRSVRQGTEAIDRRPKMREDWGRLGEAVAHERARIWRPSFDFCTDSY